MAVDMAIDTLLRSYPEDVQILARPERLIWWETMIGMVSFELQAPWGFRPLFDCCLN